MAFDTTGAVLEECATSRGALVFPVAEITVKQPQ